MTFSLKTLIVCGGITTAVAVSSAQSRLKGTVHDPTRAVVDGAIVKVLAEHFSASTQTNSRGEFSVEGVPSESLTVVVRADGFSELRVSLGSAAFTTVSESLDLVLEPATLNQQVIVSATRSDLRLSESPGSTVRLSRTDVASSPALTIDDILRQVPGFSLFRRSDSRTANPTSLGVSLRGLGASGPSRALVLEDGIPLLDPFGAWVYWNRIPPIEVASVEVFRGGASDLYGSNALGGVVQFITRQAEGPAFSLELSYGNEDTPDLSVWAGDVIGRWDFYGATDMYRSDGFIVVPSAVRGSIDTPVNSEHANVDAGVGYKIGSVGRVFVRGNFYDDARNNGTPVQTNDTRIAEGAAGFDAQVSTNTSLSARLFGDVQGYDQRFSAIASTRISESLTDLQYVPAQQLGGSFQWTHVLGKTQTLIAGTDLQEVMGASDEKLFSSGIHTTNSAVGGRQSALGFFGEDIFRIHQKWTVIAGVRIDDWRNFDGSSISSPISKPGPSSSTIFPSRNETAFSPRLSVLRSLTSNLSVTASAYRSFRAPTLNELYRSFRLGNVFTQSNAALRAERLTGAEAGMNLGAFDQKLDLRGTFYWSDIVNPVANVTLSTTSALITRQRQNLGRTRSRGLELDSVIHVSKSIELSAGYDFTDATVVTFPVNTSLQGLRIPQVPRHEFTWEVRYWNPARIELSMQGRFVGTQFDDDQNQLPLSSFYAMDFFVGKCLTRHLEMFFAAENLLNQRYVTARTPTTNLGPPILFRAGVRVNFPPGDR